VRAAAGPGLSGALLGAGTKAADLQGLHIHDLRHTSWRCGSPPASRPRRSPCARGTPRSA
jgi:hypothetical protein